MQNERTYNLEIVKTAQSLGADAWCFKDTGHRDFQPIPFDLIIWYPDSNNICAFIESKIKKKELTKAQKDFAIHCFENKSNHFVLRIFEKYFKLHWIEPDYSENDGIEYDSLEDVIKTILELISDIIE